MKGKNENGEDGTRPYPLSPPKTPGARGQIRLMEHLVPVVPLENARALCEEMFRLAMNGDVGIRDRVNAAKVVMAGVKVDVDREKAYLENHGRDKSIGVELLRSRLLSPDAARQIAESADLPALPAPESGDAPPEAT